MMELAKRGTYFEVINADRLDLYGPAADLEKTVLQTWVCALVASSCIGRPP